ncbi:hypothetical protein NDU88_005470 [Pleurodeles waltl]|uniref:Uncharacterized protein n=1 Tax=Pleurodeles waltl TaxID=8319 RepID=A0AAV7WZL8_PLEWA|nr:hypothetical protein NDU88_005470 [Pleurodeles waltl]
MPPIGLAVMVRRVKSFYFLQAMNIWCAARAPPCLPPHPHHAAATIYEPDTPPARTPVSKCRQLMPLLGQAPCVLAVRGRDRHLRPLWPNREASEVSPRHPSGALTCLSSSAPPLLPPRQVPQSARGLRPRFSSSPDRGAGAAESGSSRGHAARFSDRSPRLSRQSWHRPSGESRVCFRATGGVPMVARSAPTVF